jgi:hypothetical protein
VTAANSKRRPGIVARLNAAGGPPRSRKETILLYAVAITCAFASTAAFFLHVLGVVRMPFFINFVGMPVIVLMMIVGLYSWQRRLPFWRRLRAGIIAGALGLIAYDLVRFAIYESGILAYYPFHAIARLGSLITGQPPEADAAIFAGWLYHYWNGFSYAIIYALVAGPAMWYWGVAWAMMLEIGMLASYPTFLAVRNDWAFRTISLIGHIVYGVTIGFTVRRLAREDRTAR